MSEKGSISKQYQDVLCLLLINVVFRKLENLHLFVFLL